jgi:hypothetical protein
LFLMVLGGAFWGVSFLAFPYDSWGDPPHLRPGVAAISSNLAFMSVIFLLTSASVLYWLRENRRGWKAGLAGAALLFFFVTAAARIVWLQFYVLA